MPKLVMFKGLPCSGKTTWAKEWVLKKNNRVRVSWTDILNMTGERYRRDRLPLVIDAAIRIMCQALRNGYDVVLDEENLLPFRWGLFIARAKMQNASVEWHTMKTSVEECKRRNALKEHPVNEMEIDRKAERWGEWLKQ